MASAPAVPQAVKMALLKEFSGKREELNRFILSCMAHIVINREIYDTNERRIGFMMALLNKGEVGAWKEKFIQSDYNVASATDNRQGAHVTVNTIH